MEFSIKVYDGYDFVDIINELVEERQVDEQRVADLMVDVNRLGLENDNLKKQIQELQQNDSSETRTILFTCETCNGSGEIDETLGGYSFSDRHAKCPDCNGNGYWEKKDQTIDEIIEDREDLRVAFNLAENNANYYECQTSFLKNLVSLLQDQLDATQEKLLQSNTKIDRLKIILNKNYDSSFF